MRKQIQGFLKRGRFLGQRFVTVLESDRTVKVSSCCPLGKTTSHQLWDNLATISLSPGPCCCMGARGEIHIGPCAASRIEDQDPALVVSVDGGHVQVALD